MSHRRRLSPWLFLVAIAALPSCDTTEPTIRDLSGSWTGSLVLDNDQEITVLLVLRQGDRGEVTGDGVLGPGVFDLALLVEGVNADPDVSFTMTASDATEFFFAGAWSDDNRLEGRVGGALGGDLALVRE